MTTRAAEAPTTFQPLTHRQIMTILGGLMLGMFLAALDQTVVATAIRTIGDDLNGLSLQAWVTTAYLISSTIATPMYGKLSDLYGRKPLYLAAIGLFVLGSLLCGTAGSMYELAAYRAVQGLGGGGLMALAITILGDLLSPRERARYQAYFLAVFGTSSVLGPVVGGFLAGADELLGMSGWRWIFLVNVPLGAAAMVVIIRVLHLPPVRRVQHRIDWQGALALAGGLVPLLLVAEQGQAWGWGSTAALLCYGVGLSGLVLFVLAERRAGDDALLPLRLFRIRTFSTTALVNLVIGMGMFGGLVTLPLYLQISKGLTPTQAGLALLPLTLGIMTGSVVAGQATARTGRYKIFPVLGTVLMVGGTYALSRIAFDESMLSVGWRSTLLGVGLGLCMQPLVLAVQNAVPPKDMGVATSSSLFFRQMGGTLGTAVFLSVLFSTVGDRITTAFGAAARTPEFQAAVQDPAVAADPANAPVLDLIAGGPPPSLDDSSFINQLDPRLARPFLEGFAQSTSLVLTLAAGVVVVAFLLTLLVPELPLRQVSGIQGRLDAEAETAGAVAMAEQGVGPEAARAAVEEPAIAPVAAAPDGQDDRAAGITPEGTSPGARPEPPRR